MRDQIHIAYRRWHRVAPWFNWIKPRDGSRWWQEFDQDEYVAVSSMLMTLGNDPRLSYKHVDDITPNDKWLYEVNWFYDNDLSQDSPILDEFTSDTKLMRGLMEGNGYLVVNLALEAWCQPQRIDHVEGFMRSRGIPPSRVIYMTGALNADEIFRRHGYGMKPLPVMEFEVHASQRVRDGQSWVGERTPSNKRFLCFNRLHRPHRVSLLAMLHCRNLLDAFHYSFAKSINGLDIMDYAARYMGHQVRDHQALMSGLGGIHDRLPMVLDTNDWGPNLAHHHASDAVAGYYRDACISVITETTGFDEEVFFSEKTFHPIRHCQPFIIVSAPGSLAFLRNLGYQTFSEWWDEGYDLIPNHEDRISAIVDVVERIASWSDPELARFMDESKATCLHNLEVLRSAADLRDYAGKWDELFG